jgi:hypothetical protein
MSKDTKECNYVQKRISKPVYVSIQVLLSLEFLTDWGIVSTSKLMTGKSKAELMLVVK